MIIRPNSEKIEKLFEDLKRDGKRLAKLCVPYCTIVLALIPFLISAITMLMAGNKWLSMDEALSIVPIFAVVGAVIGFVAKSFIYNFILKNNASFIGELKKSGIKVEDGLVTGKMLKMEQSAPVNASVEILPRKTFDVAFKISQVTNIEVVDKIIKSVNYSKFCVITVGTEKYYLMCLNDADANELRNCILTYKA